MKILNGPVYITDINKFLNAQKEIKSQQAIIKKFGLLGGTTSGLAHFQPETTNKELQLSDPDAIQKYYDQLAELTIKRKCCTCEGVCATTYKLAVKILKEQSINHITIEICPLRNWGHTLLRLSLTQHDGSTETLFYDPWYQYCFSYNPHEPKVFTEEQLGTEMQQLLKQAIMIQPTKTLLDLETFKQIENTKRDFSYFVACTTGTLNNPSEVRLDPSVARVTSPCVIL